MTCCVNSPKICVTNIVHKTVGWDQRACERRPTIVLDPWWAGASHPEGAARLSHPTHDALHR
jgi:hypothetical protein